MRYEVILFIVMWIFHLLEREAAACVCVCVSLWQTGPGSVERLTIDLGLNVWLLVFLAPSDFVVACDHNKFLNS